MKILSLLPVLAVVFVAGCIGQADDGIGGGTDTGLDPNEDPQVREFDLLIFHTRYQPNSFTVNKGDTVRIFAKTVPGTGVEGGFVHNHGVTSDEYRINEAVTSEQNVNVIEFLADQAGTFSIRCMTCWDGPFGRGHPDIRAILIVQE